MWTMAVALLGCQSAGRQAAGGSDSPAAARQRIIDLTAPPAKGRQDKTTDAATSAADPSRPVAHIDGQPVLWRDMLPALTEHAGGAVLAELVLDRQVRRQLTKRGLEVTAEHVDGERVIMRETLHADVEKGRQLLAELRRRRGLGALRFAQLLQRNAGLRLLVRDQVQVAEPDVRQAYAIEYGERYEARLLVVASAVLASRIVHEDAAGRPFVDLVMAHSTDASRVAGGLIGPVSPVDPTYPKALRQALSQLAPGQVSPPVALDRGFALLKLLRKTEAQDVPFDDVKEVLAAQVRRRQERRLMQRLARTLLDEANVVVSDPALRKSWDQQQPTTTP